jgi:hypothetical protein
MPLDHKTQRVEIRLQTAFGHEPLVLRKLECAFLAAGNQRFPLGAVGLLASDRAAVADLLRNLVDHYEHYSRTAQEFKKTWAPVHTAGQVLADLLERAGRSEGACAATPREQAA